jgi:hypothetical protein
LGALYRRADIQADVVAALERQDRFKISPPPFRKNKWDFPGRGETQMLVSDALAQSRFVKSLNDELAVFKLQIVSASMEKLFFIKENGKIAWHAIVWFNVSEIRA